MVSLNAHHQPLPDNGCQVILQVDESAAALDVNRLRGEAGRHVTMLHAAFVFTAAGDDGRAVEMEQLLPALDAILGKTFALNCNIA
jgi:hypothetical protein